SMRELRAMIAQVAPTSATVLITGESGTGKELVARLIHEESQRGSGRFVALNCAAVPEQLIESELFGSEKGAFTGAHVAREGLFEAAHRGTLLLDEIGEMPLTVQPKLLRALQEGEVRRVGANVSRKFDARLIAATNRDLKECARAGTFRQDLLYRLEVIHLHVAPLRERMEDLPDLAYHFLKENSACHGKPVTGISDEAMEALLAHSWPGNVRELANVIERGVVFAEEAHLRLEDLPAHLHGSAETAGAPLKLQDGSISVPLGTPLKEVEELLIRKTLEATDGDKNMTAKILGINSRTIYRKLDKRSEREPS
ncbi:MAG: sigma-54 dependent transcriptional regulator, partial [Oligoflexia bacterium]|nr:sigma-54 dependent transcriptional regulator [Oligoflexia bacterium]